MTTRSPERMQALGYILSDGLTYNWFRVKALDVDAVTATLLVNTGDYDEEKDREIWKTVEITADDVARGLRMYREYMEGTREAFPGAHKHEARDWLSKLYEQEKEEHQAAGHTIRFVSLSEESSRDYKLRCDCGFMWPGGESLTQVAEEALACGVFRPGVHNRADEGSYGWQTVKFDRTNGEEGDYDANTADSVMQFATLGYTIFG